MNKVLKASLVLLLAALGFETCSKPEDGPVKVDPGEIICYYGVQPTYYQENLNMEGVVTDVNVKTPSSSTPCQESQR